MVNLGYLKNNSVLTIEPRAPTACRCSKFRTPRKRWSFFTDRLIVAGMLTIVSAIVSLVSFRFRRRYCLK